MKQMKYFLFAILALPFMASCADTDYKDVTPAGDPVVSIVSAPASALMGEDIELTVRCTENGSKALSNLKAQLSFSGEIVDETTLRTKENGDYTVTLHVPYLQYVPNGDAEVAFTLQNVTTKKGTATATIGITRPHFSNLQFVTADGTRYNMTESSDYTYAVTYNTADQGFKGHFETADGIYAFGADGTEATVDTKNDLSFQTAATGDVTVTFNTRDFTFGPVEELAVVPITLTATDNVYNGALVQGTKYSFIGDAAMNADDWFYDTDFFTKNSDGSYTFNAISGTYNITADFTNKYFRIWVTNGNDPATLNADGTGAIWIIGNEGVNKPTWNTINHGWWTGTDSDVCMAPVREKVYQVTLTVGKQLRANDVNFKFFGQANWGIEFNGLGGDYHLDTDNAWFRVNAANSDNGNIFLNDGVTLTDGETYVLTIDLTAGCTNGVLTVTKK